MINRFYSSIAIVRKIGEEHTDRVDSMATQIHEYGRVRGIKVFDNNIPPYESHVLFVSLGGDGTMLHAAKQTTQHPSSAIVGINLGNLGFLTDDLTSIPYNLDTSDRLTYLLDKVIERDNTAVKADKRMLLDITIGKQKFVAMNEVTLYAPLQHFVTTTVAVNSMPVGKYSGNGIIVTTATGSTALGLSAGGAIVSPNTKIMQIIPILPHQTNRQPIIVSGDDEIILRVNVTERMNELSVLADSRPIFHKEYVNGGDNILDVGVIGCLREVVIWRPIDWNFFYVIAKKIGKI